MKYRAIGIAFTVAVLGAALLFFYMKRFEDEASGGAKIPVLVVVKAIEAGGQLRDENLAERMIPQAYVETRNIRTSDRSRVVGLHVTTPLQAQQGLLWTDLALASEGNMNLVDIVQPGMRAFTLRAEGKSASLVNPGNRIDVLGTFDLPQSGQKQTSVLLQNVLVIGRGTGSQAVNNSADSGDLAISVTLQQAELLALAVEKGKLSVALRNVGDTNAVENPGLINSNALTDVEQKKQFFAPVAHGPKQF